MYEIQWLGPPRPDDPPEVFASETVELESHIEAAATAMTAFITKCEQGRRPYGFRIRDIVGRDCLVWGVHDCKCHGDQEIDRARLDGACAMRREQVATGK